MEPLVRRPVRWRRRTQRRDPGPAQCQGFSWSDTIVCLDARTGKSLWTRSFPGDSQPNNTYGYLGSSTPAVAGGRCLAICGDVAVTFGKGAVRAFQLAPDQGTVLWQPKDSRVPGDERGGSALVCDGYVCLVRGGYGNSSANCLDLQTGDLEWTEKYEHTETSSPVLVDGKIIASANLAKGLRATVMFRATPAGYRELGRLVLTRDVLNFRASPVVADGPLSRLGCAYAGGTPVIDGANRPRGHLPVRCWQREADLCFDVEPARISWQREGMPDRVCRRPAGRLVHLCRRLCQDQSVPSCIETAAAKRCARRGLIRKCTVGTVVIPVVERVRLRRKGPPARVRRLPDGVGCHDLRAITSR